MKILICHNYYQDRGGEGQTVIADKELLESRGHNVIVFSKDNREISGCGYLQKFKLFFSSFFSFSVYKQVREIVKDQKPDVAHIHNIFPLISPSIYYVLKKHNIPVVQTVHNYRFLCSNGLLLDNKGRICERCKSGNFFNAIFKKCYRDGYLQTTMMSLVLFLHRKIKTFVNKIDVFISPSEFLKRKLIEGRIPESKIVVEPHFIKCEEIKPSYEFDNYVVFIGRLSREKGLFTLIDAVKGLSLKLKIIGAGPLEGALKKKMKDEKIGNVKFLGYKKGNELKYEIEKTMAIVVPSEWYEVFGRVIIEAFALGKPIIGAKIGGIPELVENGKIGYLFRSGNFVELKNKILAFCENKDMITIMGKKARRFVEENFNPEKHYQKLMEIYQVAIKGKSLA